MPEVQAVIASRLHQRNAQVALFLGALVLGFYQFFHPTGFGFGRGFEMSAIARNLAAHGSFGNPFDPAITGPTAVVPPLYPLFLATLLKIFRLPVWMVFAATVANILVNALIAALMPRLSLVFYGDFVPGVFAGVLWMLAMRLLPQWDTTFTIGGLVLFCLLTARTISHCNRSVWPAAAAGVAGGLLSLMNPAAVLIFIPWAGFLLLSNRIPFTCAARYGATLVLTVALCNVPWAVRNYRIWHAFVLRTNFGMTIYASNNSCAGSSLAADIRNGCYQATHPVGSNSEIGLLQSLGEVRYDRRRTADALAWIRSNPVRFRQLTLARIVEFWFPEPVPPNYTAYAIWVITALSFPGVILMAMRRQPVLWFALFVWGIYPLMYYIVVSCDRYRYPLLWTSLLPAAYWLTALLPLRRPSSARAPVS